MPHNTTSLRVRGTTGYSVFVRADRRCALRNAIISNPPAIKDMVTGSGIVPGAPTLPVFPLFPTISAANR